MIERKKKKHILIDGKIRKWNYELAFKLQIFKSGERRLQIEIKWNLHQESCQEIKLLRK